jgi:hypothetical protein
MEDNTIILLKIEEKLNLVLQNQENIRDELVKMNKDCQKFSNHVDLVEEVGNSLHKIFEFPLQVLSSSYLQNSLKSKQTDDDVQSISGIE